MTAVDRPWFATDPGTPEPSDGEAADPRDPVTGDAERVRFYKRQLKHVSKEHGEVLARVDAALSEIVALAEARGQGDIAALAASHRGSF